MKRLLAILVLLVLVLALAACDDNGGNGGGGGGEEPAGNGNGDATDEPVNLACELFSAAEAEEVLDAPVENETDLGGTEATSCSYVDADDPTRVVGVGVGDFETADDAENAILRARADAQFDGLDVQQLDDIGDEAYYLPATNNFERTINDQVLTFGELGARDGTRVVTAFVTPADEDTARAVVDLTLA